VVDRVTLTEEGLEYAERAGIVVRDDDEAGESGSNPTLKELEPGRHTVEATLLE